MFLSQHIHPINLHRDSLIVYYVPYVVVGEYKKFYSIYFMFMLSTDNSALEAKGMCGSCNDDGECKCDAAQSPPCSSEVL